MAALTGNLAARQRRQLQALRDTQAETRQLLDLSRRLTVATDRQAVFNAAAQHLGGSQGIDVCVLERDADGLLQVASGAPQTFSDNERAAADWAWQHGQAAGQGSDTLPNGRWWWWPLAVDEAPLCKARPSNCAAPCSPRCPTICAPR